MNSKDVRTVSPARRCNNSWAIQPRRDLLGARGHPLQDTPILLRIERGRVVRLPERIERIEKEHV
jgi:hypothetical protein